LRHISGHAAGQCPLVAVADMLCLEGKGGAERLPKYKEASTSPMLLCSPSPSMEELQVNRFKTFCWVMFLLFVDGFLMHATVVAGPINISRAGELLSVSAENAHSTSILNTLANLYNFKMNFLGSYTGRKLSLSENKISAEALAQKTRVQMAFLIVLYWENTCRTIRLLG
jgi:hypothetical protein